MPHILIADDELAITLTLKSIFEVHGNGFKVQTASSAKEAIRCLENSEFDLVITDMKMERDTSGYDVIRAANKQLYKPAVAILTSYPLLGHDWNSEAAKSMLVKPMNTDDLLRRVNRLLEERAKDTGDQLLPIFQSPKKLKSTIVPVTLDFERVFKDIARDPKELLRLGSREFEEVVAGIWRKFGFEVELTLRTRDHGRDVIAVRKAEAHTRFLIECKRYSPENPVGVSYVRALLGVKTSERATKAILATTSRFTHPAKELFENHRWELEGRDYQGLLEWIKLATSK